MVSGFSRQPIAVAEIAWERPRRGRRSSWVPSVALATLGLAIAAQGRSYAAIEARSMTGGAVAFFVYAYCVSWVMMRYRLRALVATTVLIFVWLAAAFAFWLIVLG